jgi:AcrR family transcriptional regulator
LTVSKRSFNLKQPFEIRLIQVPHPSAHHPVRIDGFEARNRLMAAGLKLFSEHGFEKTSVRALAQAAQVNVAAVSYYFGDKAGLYRALFTESMGPFRETSFDDPAFGLDEALDRFYGDFLEPLKAGDDIRMVMKLHFREMVQPTGAWQAALERDVRPQHKALLRVLTRALGLRRPDLDAQRLAITIAGMAVHVFVFQDDVEALCPLLLSGPKSIDTMADRLAGYAMSMIEGEQRRRAAAISR